MDTSHLYTPVTPQRDLEQEPVQGQGRSREGGCRLLGGLCVLSLLVVAVLLFLSHTQLQKQEESRDTLKEAKGTMEAAGHPEALKFQANHDGKTAAHLEGERDTSGRLQWLDSTPHTFTQQGLRLVNNSMVIPAMGLYFVYSQVVFRGLGCLENQPIYLSHMVTRFSTQYPTQFPLMKAQKSVCTDVSPSHHKRRPKNLWSKSIYQGALFTLEKGDFLSTSTNGMEHLSRDSGTAFFGAFML
ncbi:lymphotoxin-alpha-like [Microcaecilia unicolor]|uniref:Lymphotoxin-alpha n=1 Tax=Microcaecilia unicolor TaxID=1415580 RepID=A0A6P7XDI4_9AMPH|nr:lymphotoxin-alpha-like [Microcaecilia unicolor]